MNEILFYTAFSRISRVLLHNVFTFLVMTFLWFCDIMCVHCINYLWLYFINWGRCTGLLSVLPMCIGSDTWYEMELHLWSLQTVIYSWMSCAVYAVCCIHCHITGLRATAFLLIMPMDCLHFVNIIISCYLLRGDYVIYPSVCPSISRITKRYRRQLWYFWKGLVLIYIS